jgi:hypothetical protein
MVLVVIVILWIYSKDSSVIKLYFRLRHHWVSHHESWTCWGDHLSRGDKNYQLTLHRLANLSRNWRVWLVLSQLHILRYNRLYLRYRLSYLLSLPSPGKPLLLASLKSGKNTLYHQSPIVSLILKHIGQVKLKVGEFSLITWLDKNNLLTKLLIYIFWKLCHHKELIFIIYTLTLFSLSVTTIKTTIIYNDIITIISINWV